MRLSFPIIVMLSLGAANLIDAQTACDTSASFDANPWLQDLDQARAAFTTKYADLEWEVFVRGLNLTEIFDETRARLQKAHSIDEAKAAFNDLARQFGDRHVGFRWPQAHPILGERKGVDCGSLGYSKQMQAEPLAMLVPAFIPLSPLPSEEFPAGILRVDGHKAAEAP